MSATVFIGVVCVQTLNGAYIMRILAGMPKRLMAAHGPGGRKHFTWLTIQNDPDRQGHKAYDRPTWAQFVSGRL